MIDSNYVLPFALFWGIGIRGLVLNREDCFFCCLYACGGELILRFYLSIRVLRTRSRSHSQSSSQIPIPVLATPS